jgi:streptogramin lyase
VALLAACSRSQPATALPVTLLSERAARSFEVPGYADFLVLEGDDAWVTNEGRVEKLTASSAAPVVSVAIAEPCGAMAVDFGALWVADCRNRTLVRVDLATHRVAATIPTGLAEPEGELSVATGAGSVWLLTDAAGVLSRIDPATNEVVARITVPPRSYAAVFGFGSVWISTSAASERDAGSGSVERVDPASNRVVATIPVGPNPRFLAAGAGGVWTLNQGDGTVSRVSPETNALVATIAAGVPGTGGDIAVAASRVWVRAKTTALSVIDPASNGVVARYGPPNGSGAVRGNDRVVWVTAHDVHGVWVLKP